MLFFSYILKYKTIIRLYLILTNYIEVKVQNFTTRAGDNRELILQFDS